MNQRQIFLFFSLYLVVFLPYLYGDDDSFSIKFLHKYPPKVYYNPEVKHTGKVEMEVYPPHMANRIIFTIPENKGVVEEVDRQDGKLTVTFSPLTSSPLCLEARLGHEKVQTKDPSLLPKLISCNVNVIPRLKAPFPLALVLLIHGDSAFMDEVGRIGVQNTIGFAYHKIDCLSYRKGTSGSFFETIRQRQNEGYLVDVFILSHGNKELLAVGDYITNEHIRRELTGSKKIRMVYMMACVSGSLVDDWIFVGASSVVGHVGDNHLPHIFSPYLFSLLGEGIPIQTASLKSYEWAKDRALVIDTAAPYDPPAQIAKDIQDSTPVFAGKNINLNGTEFPLESSPSVVPDARFLKIEAKPIQHTQLEKEVLRSLEGVIPPLQFRAIKSINGFLPTLRKIAPVLWDMLESLFPSQRGFGELTLDAGIVKDALKNLNLPDMYLEAFECFKSLRISFVSPEQYDVRLDMGVKGYSYDILPESDALEGEPYRVKFSSKVSFECLIVGDYKLSIQNISGYTFFVNLSYLPDSFKLHSLTLNIATGEFIIYARSTYTLVPIQAKMNLLKFLYNKGASVDIRFFKK